MRHIIIFPEKGLHVSSYCAGATKGTCWARCMHPSDHFHPHSPSPKNPRALTRLSWTPPASPCCHPTEKPPSAFLRGGDFWEKTKAWASPCGKKTPQNSRRYYYYHSFSPKSHHIVLPKLARNCCRAGSQAWAVPHMLSPPLWRLHHVLPSSSSCARTLFKA